MTDYAPCSGCGEVMTPTNEVCLDCAFPAAAYRGDALNAKRAREQYVRGLRESLNAAQVSLRDRFAMAIVAGGTTWTSAYMVADQLLMERAKPVPKP